MKGFERIVGQREIVQRLSALRDYYLSTASPPEHILLIGPLGMGQKLIAAAFAEELRCTARLTVGQMFERKGDMTAVLTSLEPLDLLYIDGLEKMNRSIPELLEVALRQFRIDLVIGKGSGARIHPFQLNKFTCVASVAKASDCPTALDDAFSVRLSVGPYTDADLRSIGLQLGLSKNLEMPTAIIDLLGSASGGSPHRLQSLIDRLERTSLAKHGKINENEALQFLNMIGLPTPAEPVDINRSVEKMTGIEFERLIANLLQRMGFRVELTRASGDGGIDIIAELAKPLVGGRFLIQCKRFAPETLVGAPVVREFYGALVADGKAVKGILITTSGFTAQALEFARTLPLELIGNQQLHALLEEYGVGQRQ